MSEDDYDMGEIFRWWNKEKQANRERNRESSSKILDEYKIPYVSKNGGAHLIVMDRIDFWPGTGLWMDRPTKTRRRGVFRLVKFIRELSDDQRGRTEDAGRQA
jgi:hypothetical protein